MSMIETYDAYVNPLVWSRISFSLYVCMYLYFYLCTCEHNSRGLDLKTQFVFSKNHFCEIYHLLDVCKCLGAAQLMVWFFAGIFEKKNVIVHNCVCCCHIGNVSKAATYWLICRPEQRTCRDPEGISSSPLG